MILITFYRCTEIEERKNADFFGELLVYFTSEAKNGVVKHSSMIGRGVSLIPLSVLVRISTEPASIDPQKEHVALHPSYV